MALKNTEIIVTVNNKNIIKLIIIEIEINFVFNYFHELALCFGRK